MGQKNRSPGIRPICNCLVISVLACLFQSAEALYKSFLATILRSALWVKRTGLLEFAPSATCKCCFLEQETLSTLLSTGFYPGKKRATWKISTRLLNVLPSINKVDYYYYYYYYCYFSFSLPLSKCRSSIRVIFGNYVLISCQSC